MDAKGILGLPKIPFSVTQERRPRPQRDSQRKPDGVSREVYALTGGMAPIIPTIDPSHLKRRPNLEEKGGEDVELAVSSAVTETTDKAYAPSESASPSSNNRPMFLTSTPPTATTEATLTPPSLLMLRVFLRTHALGQMVQAATSTAGIRSIKRVDQTVQDLGVHVKPKVPTKAVCAEHLELQKEILTLLNLQKQATGRLIDAPPSPPQSKRPRKA